MTPELRRRLVEAQRNEITEHRVYRRIARFEKTEANRRLLERIGDDELRHYEFWAGLTGERPEPRMGKVCMYTWLARVLGLTFALQLMESGEERAQAGYEKVTAEVPEAQAIIEDEEKHERELMRLIEEERLKYTGSMVLGLNDALVELTGAMAGLTLALGRSELIAMTGLITGVAAAMSMASSEYLATKSEEGDKAPGKAAVYTGIAYICTVLVLVAPFWILGNPLIALGCTVAAALLIILAFTFYISVAKALPFKHRFLEMAGLSLGVAGASFVVGYLVRVFLGVDV